MQGTTSDWFGLVNLNKPSGWSSRKAVDHLKPMVRPAKIGHAGTLDPLATGVLVLCIGPATRLVPYLHDQAKEYEAEFEFGLRSSTDDVEGDVEQEPDARAPVRAEIESVLPQFIGQIEQVPPAFSAVKIRGQRAYELARRGKTPQVTPRTVEVSELRILDYDYPRLRLSIRCGSGTYIRSLGRDLACALGTSAVMSRLVRTRVGSFTLESAVPPEAISPATLDGHIRPAQEGLGKMPQVAADESMLDRLLRGLRCPAPSSLSLAEGDEAAVLNEAGRLQLIAFAAGDRELQPKHVFFPKSGRP